MKPSIHFTLLFLMFFNFNTVIFAQSRSTAFPRLEPDPKALEYYLIGQQSRGYTWTDFAEISLWASGDTAASNLEKIRSAAETIKNSEELPADGKEKAEFILSFMHKNILRSYSLYQTRVDTIFTNGRYNCVSSAVLYMILCKSAGINVSGVMTKEHAFAMVHIDGEDIDVETTNAYGFDPGNRKEFHDQFGRLTGFSYVPAQNYRDRQTINEIELVSLILNNRIADHERQNRYADAVPIAIDRAALLTGNELIIDAVRETSDSIFTDPRNDLMDRLFNFGATLLRSGREEDCLRWAAAASPLYPDEDRWQEFIMAAVNNNLMKMTRAQRITEARNFLEEQKAFLTAANYAQLDITVTDAELLNSANKIQTAADGDAVVSAIELAGAASRIGERRAVELLTFAVQKTASALSAAPARDWRAASLYIENAINRFGTNREWEQALRTYKSNMATDYHNRFAAEWNKRNFDEAERILNEGLAEFPDNRQLLTNKQTVDRHHSR